ncbi:type II toxin-antitoxin system RelE/ParE family toxin [Caenimonas aquaedulcis]|uniref:Type II toxin-antitoxin system RelE/ParE family toxin n=1 Tax=Caenimonas aquaedulcis TaxID=2793270 RepID=A0A931H163_9BURK|nr:type II toxin-antitoxin system RelE/ParE family toxin [Caenimonas aquaedulcis]MBG9386667.1 type II toxin-antitoxin system RelE/ParE family toxin [Caenimonas aquaedulcis]
MTAKAVVRRSQAQKDIQRAADHYFAEGGTALEVRFIDAMQAAIRKISAHPGIGSPRHSQTLSVPGLRAWRLTRFPYLVFYVEREDAIDVWRVLHEQRDIPARFASGGT